MHPRKKVALFLARYPKTFYTFRSFVSRKQALCKACFRWADHTNLGPSQTPKYWRSNAGFTTTFQTVNTPWLLSLRRWRNASAPPWEGCVINRIVLSKEIPSCANVRKFVPLRSKYVYCSINPMNTCPGNAEKAAEAPARSPERTRDYFGVHFVKN